MKTYYRHKETGEVLGVEEGQSVAYYNEQSFWIKIGDEDALSALTENLLINYTKLEFQLRQMLTAEDL